MPDSRSPASRRLPSSWCPVPHFRGLSIVLSPVHDRRRVSAFTRCRRDVPRPAGEYGRVRADRSFQSLPGQRFHLPAPESPVWRTVPSAVRSSPRRRTWNFRTRTQRCPARFELPSVSAWSAVTAAPRRLEAASPTVATDDDDSAARSLVPCVGYPRLFGYTGGSETHARISVINILYAVRYKKSYL